MSQQFTIRGLVGFAGKLRKALRDNPDPAAWQQQTEHLITAVNAQLQSQKIGIDELTKPTRNAYLFLRDIDFRDASQRREKRPAPDAKLPQLRFPGMQRHLNDITGALCSSDEDGLAKLAETITDYHRQLEHSIRHDQIEASQLSSAARAARAWFAWLSDPTRLRSYHHAATRLQTNMATMAQRADLGQHRFAVHFRPVAGLYRLATRRTCIELRVPTAMMTLPADCLDELARHALNISRDRQRLLAAVHDPAYQGVVAELEALGGRIDRSRGQVHDLRAAFKRVNQRFFNDEMEAPELCWSGRSSYRKLGHYDPQADSIVISSVLDSSAVPEAALDFVVFHELLHKRHGFDWNNEQARVHTPAFRRDERRYPDKTSIEALLGRVSAAQR